MKGRFRHMLHSKSRTIRSIILVLFAVLLTAGAVTGQQALWATRTNTGAPGSTSVSSIKNFGSGNFVSDYQGAYFYILPYREMTVTADSVFEGTLFYTTKTDSSGEKMTYREIMEEYGANAPDTTSLMSWGNQYTFIKQQGYTSVPPQTSEALLFVPYTTHNGTTLQEGWKANISSICYYDAHGNTPADRYKVSTASSNLKNRIFAPAYSASEFNKYCKDGVFYGTLAKWTADTDGELAETDVDIASLRDKDKLGSKAAIKKLVAGNKKLQTEGYSLWCYILSLDQKGDTLSFDASTKIAKFIADGYNNSIAQRNRAYDKEDNPTGVGLGSGLEKEYKLVKWTDGNVNGEEFRNNKFAQREYNLHTLDLMLCAYAAAVRQGADSEVTDAWLDAIYDYVNFSDAASGPDNNSNLDANRTVPIAICGGTIARGADQTKSGGTTNRIVYVGTQDLINFAGLLENAGADTLGGNGSNDIADGDVYHFHCRQTGIP